MFRSSSAGAAGTSIVVTAVVMARAAAAAASSNRSFALQLYGVPTSPSALQTCYHINPPGAVFATAFSAVLCPRVRNAMHHPLKHTPPRRRTSSCVCPSTPYTRTSSAATRPSNAWPSHLWPTVSGTAASAWSNPGQSQQWLASIVFAQSAGVLEAGGILCTWGRPALY